MRKTQKQIYTVNRNSKNLGFFASLDDVVIGEPKYYLKPREQVERIVTDNPIYGGLYGDKEYFKVTSSKYGIGYMLAEGLTEVVPNART